MVFHAAFNDTNRTDVIIDVPDDEEATGKVVQQFVKYFCYICDLDD